MSIKVKFLVQGRRMSVIRIQESIFLHIKKSLLSSLVALKSSRIINEKPDQILMRVVLTNGVDTYINLFQYFNNKVIR